MDAGLVGGAVDFSEEQEVIVVFGGLEALAGAVAEGELDVESSLDVDVGEEAFLVVLKDAFALDGVGEAFVVEERGDGGGVIGEDAEIDVRAAAVLAWTSE